MIMIAAQAGAGEGAADCSSHGGGSGGRGRPCRGNNHGRSRCGPCMDCREGGRVLRTG